MLNMRRIKLQIKHKRITYRMGDQFVLKPIFDVHLGNRACDENAFRSYLADSDERTFFIGGGDLMDAVITSDLKRYRKGIDMSPSEAIIDYQVDRAAAFLSPYREQILGLGSGNHEDTLVTKCSTDMTKRLCTRLDVPFLGYSGLFALRFTQGGQGGRTVVIRYHHGWAAGRTQGGQLTSNAKDVMHFDADVCLYGHGHKLLTDSIARLGISKTNRFISKDIIICLCGSFLKTYLEGETTYSEKKGYPPTRIGSPYISIRPTKNSVELKAHTN